MLPNKADEIRRQSLILDKPERAINTDDNNTDGVQGSPGVSYNSHQATGVYNTSEVFESGQE